MNKSDKCINCNNYKAFYQKGIFSFWEKRRGICCKNSQEIVSEIDYCKDWTPSIKRVVTVEVLDNAIEDIKILIKCFNKR